MVFLLSEGFAGVISEIQTSAALFADAVIFSFMGKIGHRAVHFSAEKPHVLREVQLSPI